MKIILGVDQGATHTRAALCSERGEILGVGYAAGASHTYSGLETALLRVREAAAEAQWDAGLDALEAAVLLAGMSGADWPDETGLLEGGLRRAGGFAAVRVVNDAVIALRAGTSQPYGAVLIGGTAANCAVRSPRGEEFIFGFYHDPALLGAHAIARQALYQIFHNHAYQLEEPLLTRLFLARNQFDSVDQLCRSFYEQKIADVHLLAPLVFEADRGGDQAARSILAAYGRGSAALVLAGLRRFQMTQIEVEVVLSGSLFKDRESTLIQAFGSELLRQAPQASIVHARYEPVVGALLLGLESLGIEIDTGVLERLDACAAHRGLLRVE